MIQKRDYNGINYGSIEAQQLLPCPDITAEGFDLLQSSQPGYGTRSPLEVSLNIVNATVGSGVIGLPFALYLSGFTLGIAISVFVGLLTFVAIYSLIVTGQRSQIFNFASLAQVAMGRFGFHMLNLMLFIQSAGSVISYFILVGDTIPVLLGFYLPQYPILANRELVTTVISLVIIFPLNLFRSIGALAKWSAFSVLLLPVMIFSVLLRAPFYSKDHTAPLMTIGKDPIAAMGIMSFAFVCSQVAFPNYLSQKNQTLSSWKFSSALSTIMSWVISMSFAAIGYLSFGQDVGSNVFSSFPEDDHIINIGRLALGLSMVLTVPMGFYPARDALQKTIGFETKERQPTPLQHYGVTIVLFAIFLLLGVQIHSLGKVYSVVGGIASSFLAYIIPGAAYIAVFHPQWISALARNSPTDLDDETASVMGSMTKVNLIVAAANPTWWLDIAAIVLVIFGFLVMSYTFISAFIV